MNAENHNRFIGIGYLMYATATTLVMVLVLFAFLMSEFNVPLTDSTAEYVAHHILIAMVFTSPWLIFVVPSLLTAYGMLKQKIWARTIGIITGLSINLVAVLICGIVLLEVFVSDALSSILTVYFFLTLIGSAYALMFLFSLKGKEFYQEVAERHYNALPQRKFT